MSTEEPLLSLQDVEVEFGEEPLIGGLIPDSMKERLGLVPDRVPAVEGVSLDIEENDVVAIVGESGSGKTTLGKTAIGLEEPAAGSVRYRGHDIWDVKENGTGPDGNIKFSEIRKALQIVHQDPGAALNPYRTVGTTLEQPLKLWFPEMSYADREERILRLLEECGLTPPKEYESRYPHELSGGEKQRVTLIRAMLVEPDVLLADEPVSALDPSLRVDIMDLMLKLQRMFDTSFVFVSHNLEHARYIGRQTGGRIAVMYLGEIVEVGPIEDVLENPSHPYTKVLKWASLPIDPREAREALQSDLPIRELDIPDVSDKPPGCKFHTRCPQAREACRRSNPSLHLAGGDSEAACFREIEDHEYWESQPVDEQGVIDIPE